MRNFLKQNFEGTAKLKTSMERNPPGHFFFSKNMEVKNLAASNESNVAIIDL